jgi:hypothetical protein
MGGTTRAGASFIDSCGGSGEADTRARQMFDTIFAKKEDAASVPVVRLVTIWFGTSLHPLSATFLPLHPFA